MKIWRLVSGILSIVMFLIISFQSCAVGLVNVVEDNAEDTSGSGGMFVAFMLLVAGIVSVSLKNNSNKGAAIALSILYGAAAIIGYSNLGTFADLAVWSSWALICAIVAVISLFSKSDK